MTCRHVKLVNKPDGVVAERPYSSIFCPDCGVRIEPPGKTRPFHLRPEQR